jgi:hypothetical protein
METASLDQSRKLALEQQAFYKQNGYLSPRRVLGAEEASGYEARFVEYMSKYAQQLCGLLQRDRRVYLSEAHLFLSWVYRIVAHPAVLDAVESVLGPNILVWGAQWFPKLPGDNAYVSWHQDGTYWGLHPPNVTTAWIALSDSTPENGCMRVVPGTHHTPKLPQRETYAPDNMLSRGQEIAVQVDESRAVDLVLQPGEMSLHHIGIVHGSGPNRSDHARIGLAVRYIGPEVRQEGSARDLAVLVRGKDEYGHFDLVEPPERDSSPEQSSVHAEALRRKAANTLPKNGPNAK